MNHKINARLTDCKCDIVIRIWNLDPERYEFRQNWLAQNVPSVFNKKGRKYDKDGTPIDILQCKDCGRKIEVPLL